MKSNHSKFFHSLFFHSSTNTLDKRAHQYIPVFALPSSYKTKKLDTRDNIVLQALKKLMFLLFESFYPSGLF